MNSKLPFLKQEEEQQTINRISLMEHRRWSSDKQNGFNRTYSQLLALPHQMRRRLQRQFGLLLVGVALALALSSMPIASIIRAEPANVPTAGITVDGTTCTLEEAITSANNDNAASNGCVDGSGPDIITLAVDVTLAAALPAITTDITIEGDGHFIDGAGSFRVLEVSSANGNLTLNSATIRNGSAVNGGGIFVRSNATATVNNSTISGNSAGGGGGGGISNSESVNKIG